MSVLNGATNIIRMNPKATWIVEISITENQPVGTSINPNLISTFNVFFENGYSAFTADRSLRPIVLEDIFHIYNTNDDILDTHNVLFVPQSSNIAYIRNIF